MRIENEVYAVVDNKERKVIALVDELEDAYGYGLTHVHKARSAKYWESIMKEEDYESIRLMERDLIRGLDTLWDAFEISIKRIENLGSFLYNLMI